MSMLAQFVSQKDMYERSSRHRLLLHLLVALCVIGISIPAVAQSGRGVITGIVKDASGAVVPGADITITEKTTGVETKSATTDAGVYRAPYMPPGTYRITAGLAGFKTALADNIQLLLGQTVTVDFTLEVGQVSEQVTVTASAPLLETSTSEIGINSTQKEVHTWPILVGDGTRQLQQFVFTSLPGTHGGTFEGTINGGQTYSHEILIEGITLGRFDLNGGSNNEFTPTMDAVSEFKLHTGSLSSQYGNTQTALANFGLKSGTNDYHGTLFYFHQNKSLNANSWGANRFGQKKPPIIQHNYGATFGGPARLPWLYNGKDRTHFFVSVEQERLTDQRIGGTDSMPIAAFKKGDFSKLLDPAFTLDSRSGTTVGTDALGRPVVFGQVYDPTTSRQVGNTWVRDPLPNNQIPSSKYSRLTNAILKHDFTVDPALNLLRDNNPRVSTCCPRLEIDNWSIKVDHVLTSSHKFATYVMSNDRGRRRYGSNVYAIPGINIPGPAMSGDRFQNTPGWVVRMTEDWTIGPTMLNHFAYGYNRFRNANQSNAFLAGKKWATELGMVNVGEATFPQITFAGNNNTLSGTYRSYGDTATGDAPNGSGVVQNDFTWLRGNHSFRFGAEHRRYYLNSQSTMNAGSYAFHNENTALPGFANQTGFAYASFLLGTARSAGLGIPRLTPGYRTRSTSFYFQDDWKVRSNLTLNLGLRWDIPSPYTEVLQRMSGLDPTKPNPKADNFPGALAFLGDCAECTGQGSFASTFYKQIAPRVGFAWAPENRKMVIRGGYGINFSPPILDGFNFPYFAGFDGSNPVIARTGRFTEDPSYLWDNPYPAFTQVLPNRDPSQRNRDSIGWYQPETRRMPYVQNWNFGIQYEMPWEIKLEANYIGNRGLHLNEPAYEGALNQLDPKHLTLGDTLLDPIASHPEIKKPYPSFTGTVARALRPFPQFEGISTHRLNGGFSNYNSLQVTGIKRMSHGLSFLAAYTFAKTLATSDSTGPTNYSVGQNFYNRRSDYSVVQYHIPQDFKLTWIYDLPFGPGARWLQTGLLSKVLGGWTVSTIQRYRSGAPLQINASGFDSQVLFNPGIRGDVLLPRDQQILSSGKPGDIPNPSVGVPYLNPAAFGTPPKTGRNVPVRLGTAPRYLNDLRGFAVRSEDLSLIKRTTLGFGENANFELRADIANLFNRVRLGDPNTNTSDPSRFGRILGKAGGPRTIQVGLRLSF
ncbi:MAG: TonB-dependent receptor [Acidobacteria bacterium]|nr:TonB-dependent receptor [Acidobacteriota bacterium]